MTAESAALLPAERRARLVQRLRENGWARVSDLSEALGVTAVTVRRDIAQLADEGVLERVRGGARLTPDPRHQALAVGIVVPSLDYYYPEVIRGARVAAADADVRIILRNGTYDADEIRRQVAALADSADGLLVTPPVDAPEVTEWLATLDVPVVLVERRGQTGPFHEHGESVVTDHAFGAAMAVRHLAAEGHSRIGLVTSRTSPTTRRVRAGWREAITELGLDPEGDLPDLDTVPHNEPGWHDDAERVLDTCRSSGTTALLVHSDPEAISLVEHARDRGLRIPEDLAVVAYDDELAGLADPPITGVRPPKAALGATALDLLVKRLTDPERPVHRVQLSPRLVVRASSRRSPA